MDHILIVCKQKVNIYFWHLEMSGYSLQNGTKLYKQKILMFYLKSKMKVIIIIQRFHI